MHQCTICKKEFATQKALNAHQIAHKEGPRYTQKRRTEKKTFICKNCGKENKWSHSSNNKFCDTRCDQELRHKERISLWKEGKGFPKGSVKRFLSEKKSGCWCCGIAEWNGKDIVLDLEHIDGNSENNTEDNLSLLCPNCHSQTPTYKGKNRGNGRLSRRVRYSEGKSF